MQGDGSLAPFTFFGMMREKVKQVIVKPRRAREKSESGIYHVI